MKSDKGMIGARPADIEDMDPGELTDVIEYDGCASGMAYDVYGEYAPSRSGGRSRSLARSSAG